MKSSRGTYKCPICGLAEPHGHDKRLWEKVQVWQSVFEKNFGPSLKGWAQRANADGCKNPNIIMALFAACPIAFDIEPERIEIARHSRVAWNAYANESVRSAYPLGGPTYIHPIVEASWKAFLLSQLDLDAIST